MGSEMISFAMGRGGGGVGVGGKIMELSNSSVRALWHGLLLISSMLAWPYEICNRAKRESLRHPKAEGPRDSPSFTGKGIGAMT
jgi:hypothetical protein